MKRYVSLLIVILLIAAGCTLNPQESAYEKYNYQFFGAFDTVIEFVGFAKNKNQFEEMAQTGQARFEELHKLFDIYNDYDGINNIKTINDNAGVKPVEVSQEIIDLLLFAKEWYIKTNGTVNVALGPVLSIWHDYREEGKSNPENAKVPNIEILKEANKLTDISKLEIDLSKNTVFLKDKGMRLDVGAIAKGYATQIVVSELKKAGYDSFIISAGGNVCTVGKPKDGRNKWGIGIQDPDANPLIPDTKSLDTVFVTDASLVTSGDYERYYEVNGQRYHHLIDPVTLMPATYYRAVTILTSDSGIADTLSTAAFLLPHEQSRALIESIDGVDALWIMPDGTMNATENMKNSLKNMGGATNK